jgi:AcrR family transcriptional regulator
MSGGKRGPYAPGLQRRERILDAASSRFAAEGFSRSTIADIARDAGVTAPAIKHYFASKDDLLIGLARRRFERALETAHEAPEDEDGTGTLRLMLQQTELRAAQPELIDTFVQVVGLAADRSSPAHELFATRYERVVDDLTARFASSVDRGLLRRDVDYAAVAREFIAVSDGLQIQFVLTGGAIDMVGMMRDHLERLAPEILATGESVSLATD